MAVAGLASNYVQASISSRSSRAESDSAKAVDHVLGRVIQVLIGVSIPDHGSGDKLQGPVSVTELEHVPLLLLLLLYHHLFFFFFPFFPSPFVTFLFSGLRSRL